MINLFVVVEERRDTMKKTTDPFTRTPGIAGQAYIDCGISDEIISDFSDKNSSKYVYKITGLRGSGKSVEYSNIIQALKKRNDWLVYPLSASGNMLSTLISKMSMEKFISSTQTSTSVNSTTSIGGNAFVVSGNETISVSKTSSDNDHYYSDEATITHMISIASERGYKVLIGIDDISKTKESVTLLSIVGALLLEGFPVYLVVTGLSDNIEDISSEKYPSFFKREVL